MFLALRRIHVSASDFPRSRRFYGETLALPEAGSFENDWVEFALGPLILKLTPLRPGEVPSRNQVAAVFSTWSLDETIAKLKERGVTVTRPPADEFTGRSAEILDPDGYRIIVFQASDLHPDEEWVPTSQIDDLVKQKLHARKRREQARTLGGAKRKKARRRPAPKKKAAKKTRPARKRPAKKAARRPARRRAAKAKRPKRPARKKANRRRR